MDTYSIPNDNLPLEFGKYKGFTPNEIAEHDPHYMIWVYENITNQVVSRNLVDRCRSAITSYEEERLDDLYYGIDEW